MMEAKSQAMGDGNWNAGYPGIRKLLEVSRTVFQHSPPSMDNIELAMIAGHCGEGIDYSRSNFEARRECV